MEPGAAVADMYTEPFQLRAFDFREIRNPEQGFPLEPGDTIFWDVTMRNVAAMPSTPHPIDCFVAETDWLAPLQQPTVAVQRLNRGSEMLLSMSCGLKDDTVTHRGKGRKPGEQDQDGNLLVTTDIGINGVHCRMGMTDPTLGEAKQSITVGVHSPVA